MKSGRKDIADRFDEWWDAEESSSDLIWSQRIYDRIRSRINTSDDGFVVRKQRAVWWSVAAIFVLGVGLIMWQWNGRVEVPSPASMGESRVVTTGLEREQIDLPDHSVISLSPGSELSYPAVFSADVRRVEQKKGQAFYEIKREEERPFEVWVGDVVVTVLGTTFGVNFLQHKTEVEVKSGKVRVENVKTGEAVILVRDELFIYEPGKHVFKKVVKNNLSKKANLSIEETSVTITFKNQTLRQILASLEQETGFDFISSGQLNSQVLFSQKYEDQSLMLILADLSKIYQFDFKRTSQRIELVERSD